MNRSEAKAARCVADLINGNLTDAKRQACYVNAHQLFVALFNSGASADKASRGAFYLKTGKCWQSYCDAN